MAKQIPGPGWRASVLAVAISQLFSMPAWAAQSDVERIAELEKKLEKSMALIQQLSSRLAAVEGKANTAQAAELVSAKIAEQDSRIDQLEKSIVQVSDNAAKRRDLGLPLHGFADVGSHIRRTIRPDAKAASPSAISTFCCRRRRSLPSVQQR
jgi:uncharacterized coiled-coil protein SlyX